MVATSARAGPVAAVVLAAGAATRFGAPKQNLLLPAVLARLAAVSLDETIVVAGAHSIEAQLPTATRLIQCPGWKHGPGASLKCGLAALSQAAAAAIVVLADGPRIDPLALERVIDAWRDGAGPILAAAYDGERAHPVLLARAAWGQIPASGGRDLDAALVDCSDLRHPGDVDTVSDLSRLGEELDA